MNDNNAAPIDNARVLSALQEVSPALEKLMAERFALRQLAHQAQADLEKERRNVEDLRRFHDVLVPRYIAAAKALTLTAAAFGLIALATAFFTGLIDTKILAPLFASLLLPLWLVELAERRFGRWEMWSGSAGRIRFRHAIASATG